ncbi:MAG: hypothetical protein DWI70_06685 [Chloroflexi bacterium]|nr:MAG: hypothetical protein DWI70_06685 [Chloroflexota bacterium]
MKVFASLLFAGLMLLSAAPALAHQPVVVASDTTEVVDPEISKAYYGVLSGAAHTYLIRSDIEFDLYVGILVPDSESPKRDVKAEIFRGDELVETLGGVDAEWVTFYEPFGQNTYWDAGEYRLRAAPGVYSIRISSPDNTSKYSLAIGEIEFFDLEDRANALAVLPGIQEEFFGSSAVELVGTRYGMMNLVVIYGAALLAALLYRLILRRPLVRLIGGTPRRIGKRFRVAAAVALFAVAITTTWSPMLLFASGLLLFEALLNRFGVAESHRSGGATLR